MPRVLRPVRAASCLCTCRRRPRSPCRRRRLHALDQPRCCACPRRRRPASLCCSLSLSAAPLSPAQPEHLRCCITGTYFARHLCSARTRMREIIWCVAGCGAQSGAPSTALAIMLNRFCTVDGPLSGPKHQNSSEKGRVRSTRGAGGRQTLPTPWPIGTALARAPDRSRRRPGAVLHCRTVDFLKKARC